MLNKLFCDSPVMLALKSGKQQVFLEFEKMRSLLELEGNYAFQRRAKALCFIISSVVSN